MSFTSKLRSDESQYKLVRQIIRFVCTENKLEFDATWKSISNKDTDYFDRFFRRVRRRNDPLADVKKPRTAFSFFTRENRPDITAKHPELPFGDVSRLVGRQWQSMDEAARAKYIKLEAEDKKRYHVARDEVRAQIELARQATASIVEAAAAATIATMVTTVEQAVAQESAPSTQESAPSTQESASSTQESAPPAVAKPVRKAKARRLPKPKTTETPAQGNAATETPAVETSAKATSTATTTKTSPTLPI